MGAPEHREDRADKYRLSQTQDLKGIGGAWAGGGDGMGLTNILLPQIPVSPPKMCNCEVRAKTKDILAPEGRFYLVAVQQNKPLAIIEYMNSLGLEAEVSSKSERILTPPDRLKAPCWS